MTKNHMVKSTSKRIEDKTSFEQTGCWKWFRLEQWVLQLSSQGRIVHLFTRWPFCRWRACLYWRRQPGETETQVCLTRRSLTKVFLKVFPIKHLICLDQSQAQYSGHVTCMDQSELSIYLWAPSPLASPRGLHTLLSVSPRDWSSPPGPWGCCPRAGRGHPRR